MRERYLRLTRENFRENGLSSGISPGISFQVAEHRFSGMGETERGIYKAGNQPRPFDETLSPPSTPSQPHFSATFLPSSIPLAFSHRSSLPTLWFPRVLLILLTLPPLNTVFYYTVFSNPLCIPLRPFTARICLRIAAQFPFFFFSFTSICARLLLSKFRRKILRSRNATRNDCVRNENSYGSPYISKYIFNRY